MESGKQHYTFQKIPIVKYKNTRLGIIYCQYLFFFPPLSNFLNILFLIILYYCLLRLTAFSILQSKWVHFERFWLHIHLAITVRQSLPVHLYHSITDLFMTLCSKNGQRYVGLIVCLSFRYRKLSLWLLYLFFREMWSIFMSVQWSPCHLAYIIDL